MNILVRKLGRYKYLVIIIILFILYNCFFINKAFHIDDPFTISVARGVNIDFFRPGRISLNNPLLMGYYYAPIIKIFGEKELWLHIFYLPFSLLLIISMYFLSLRFTNKSLFPVLFLISTPVFIITSQNIMSDIPLLGFFLAAVVTFIYGIDKNDNLPLVLSGLLASIAIFIKYSGLMVIPILFIYALLNAKREKIKFLLIPLLLFLLWNVCCSLFYKEAMFFSALLARLNNYFLNRISMRMFASLSFLSGTSVIILFLIPLFLQKRIYFFYFFLSFLIGSFPFLIRDIFGGYSLFEKAFLAVFFIASAYTILLIFGAGARSLFKKYNKDTLFLSSWFFLIFAFNLLTNFIAARFLLLLLPPLFILIYNELLSCKYKFAKLRVKFIFSISISIIFSTILAIGDYQFAGLYRHFVHSLKKIIPLNEEVYFGHGYYYYNSWGYAYYLEKFHHALNLDYKIKERLNQQDVIFITPSEPVLPIVIEKRSTFDKLLVIKYNRDMINSIYYKGNIILHNRRFHAGFYCHDWGLLPFYLSLRKVPLEVFEIYQLSYSTKDDS